MGKRMLERALIQADKNIDELGEEHYLQLLAQTHTDSIDELFEAIGLGRIAAANVAQSIAPEAVIEGENSTPITIERSDGVLISFARCCWPIPGDPIVGHLSADKGIVVHRETCNNVIVLRNKKENIANTHWSENIQGEFLAEIRVEVLTERGIIASLATRLARSGTSI